MIALYFLLTIFLLGVLALVHEAGHFFVARMNGIEVLEFAIGMGPKLISHVSAKSGIRYSLRLFPIGGFVSMVGEDDESDNPNSFNNVSVIKRITTLLAGPLTNILVGFICMLIIVVGSDYLTSTIVAEFSEDASSSAWLMVNDKILSVNGVKVVSGNDLYYEVMHSGNKPVTFTVLRNGEKITLSDVIFPTFSESGATFGQLDFKIYSIPKTFGGVLEQSFFRSLSTIKMIWDSIIDVVTGRYGVEAVSGPIGITETVGEVVQSGGMNLLYIFTVLAMNLGVFNLLPLPALDGGQLVIAIAEGIIRRPISAKVKGYINAAGLMFFFALMILVTFKDIFMLFRK